MNIEKRIIGVLSLNSYELIRQSPMPNLLLLNWFLAVSSAFLLNELWSCCVGMSNKPAPVYLVEKNMFTELIFCVNAWINITYTNEYYIHAILSIISMTTKFNAFNSTYIVKMNI